MIHPDTELRHVSDVVGVGVFATRPIPRGTITWVRCALDRTFTDAQVAAFAPSYRPHIEKYAYLDREGRHVLCWDLARFMNHSCAPSCISPGFDVDIAVRDIGVGEQLTCDYGMLNLNEPFPCACEMPGCRGTIGDDWDALSGPWDERVRAAFPRVVHAAQPLAVFVGNWHEIEAASRGETPVPSCTGHRFRATSSR